jgi:hypothetical protein
MKGAKTIAEYTIRRWLQTQGFVMDYFDLNINGNKGILKDRNGDTMTLVYDNVSKTVYVEEITD